MLFGCSKYRFALFSSCSRWTTSSLISDASISDLFSALILCDFVIIDSIAVSLLLDMQTVECSSFNSLYMENPACSGHVAILSALAEYARIANIVPAIALMLPVDFKGIVSVLSFLIISDLACTVIKCVSLDLVGILIFPLFVFLNNYFWLSQRLVIEAQW